MHCGESTGSLQCGLTALELSFDGLQAAKRFFVLAPFRGKGARRLRRGNRPKADRRAAGQRAAGRARFGQADRDLEILGRHRRLSLHDLPSDRFRSSSPCTEPVSRSYFSGVWTGCAWVAGTLLRGLSPRRRASAPPHRSLAGQRLFICLPKSPDRGHSVHFLSSSQFVWAPQRRSASLNRHGIVHTKPSTLIRSFRAYGNSR